MRSLALGCLLCFPVLSPGFSLLLFVSSMVQCSPSHLVCSRSKGRLLFLLRHLGGCVFSLGCCQEGAGHMQGRSSHVNQGSQGLAPGAGGGDSSLEAPYSGGSKLR